MCVSGTNCEVQLNICITDNPCQNGGKCVAVGNSYICRCPMGYSGATCTESKSDQLTTGMLLKYLNSLLLSILYFIVDELITPIKLYVKPRGEQEKSSAAYFSYKNHNSANIGHKNMNDASF